MLAHFRKVILLVLALNILVGGTYAFAAQDTVADGPVVYKTSMIFGYDVTGIIFHPNETDPTVVDTITFHIAPSNGSAKANHVMIQTETDGPWTKCSLVDYVLPARVATCTFESLAAEDVTALTIVAE
jgi:hypothetical protein